MLLCCRVLVVASLLATIASTLQVYPHQFAYFNELTGGPENGHKHLLHSNLDWSQDFLLVREWMEERDVQPEEVRVVHQSSHLTAVMPLACPCDSNNDDVRWEIVSTQKAYEPESPWRGRMATATAHRIGYTLWAFPVASKHR